MQTSKGSLLPRIDRNFEMPSVPVVLTKFLQMVDDDRASARRLEELILHDPSLSSRILKLANSAFYSFRSEVKTISHAIALLGLNFVKSLAIGVSIFESFTRGLRDETGFINQLWMHSFGTGAMAQEIWTGRSNRVEGEFALLCGLLHDLGKIAFFKSDPLEYSRIFATDKDKCDADIGLLELNHYGLDHAALGSHITKQWGLPLELTVAIKHHHTVNVDDPLAAAVSMADMLVKMTGIGYDGDCRIRPDLPALQDVLAMEQREFDQLYDFAIAKRTDVEEFFQFNQ